MALQFLVRLNDAVSDLNQLNHTVANVRELWGLFSAAGKNTIKTQSIAELDRIIEELQTVKTEIQGL